MPIGGSSGLHKAWKLQRLLLRSSKNWRKGHAILARFLEILEAMQEQGTLA